MDYKQIISEISSRKFAPIYFLYGDEPYFIDLIAEKLSNTVLSESEKSFNQTMLYGKETDFKMVVDNARQFPMMSEFKTIFLREAQDMRDFGMLENYFANPTPHSVLVISYKNKKPDKRTKWWKALQKTGLTYESKKLYDSQIGKWIQNYVQNKKMRIDDRTSALIGEYLGTNISKVTNEIDKLCLNKKEGDIITIDDVQNEIGISKDYNVFELQNALGQRNAMKAYRIIQYFGANPKSNPLVVVIGVLFSYFQKVYTVHQYLNLSDRDLASKAQIYNSYFLKDYKIAAKNYNKAQLERIFLLLQQYDLKSKGINTRNMTDDAILKELVFGILH